MTDQMTDLEKVGERKVKFGKYKNLKFKELSKSYAIWFLHNVDENFLRTRVSKGVPIPIKEYLIHKFNITVNKSFVNEILWVNNYSFITNK